RCKVGVTQQPFMTLRLWPFAATCAWFHKGTVDRGTPPDGENRRKARPERSDVAMASTMEIAAMERKAEENRQLRIRLEQLKKERNAIILAHYYQRDEIQEVADFRGDSFLLAQKAASTDADVIVFCGVHFMAESAKILAPDKIVLMPDERAGCPMADMVNPAGLRALKAKHPNARVVTYINSSAEVKAETDICCTSSNAVKVVNSVDSDEVIWCPDKNLGHYVSQHTDKKMIIWEG